VVSFLSLSSESSGAKWILALVDQGVFSAGSILTSIIIGRVCGKEELGLYLLGMSIIELIREVQTDLIGSPYIALSQGFSGSDHEFYAGSTLIHQWTISVLAMLILAGTGVYLSYGKGAMDLGRVIWMLAIAGGFITFRDYVRHICFAGFQMKTVLMLDAFTTSFQVGGMVLLAYMERLSAAYALGVMGFASCLATVTWFIGFRKRMKFSLNRGFSDLRKNWSFGKWILAGNLVFFMGSQLYPWILVGFHSTAAVGVLAACQGIAGFANPLLHGTRNFLGPRAAQTFAHGGKDELRKLMTRSTLMIAVLMTLLCGAIMVFGGKLVVFIYGPQYGGHNWVIALLALNILAIAVALASDCGIWAMGRNEMKFRIELVRLLITFTIGFWLVKRFGPLGVAGALLLGNVMVLSGQYLIFRRLTYSKNA
jgi:O-antigen/teichoic acid export membrane protein